MLNEGEDVGQNLAGMEFIGQAVDDRHAGVPLQSCSILVWP
jgi:hypothetical protein